MKDKKCNCKCVIAIVSLIITAILSVFFIKRWMDDKKKNQADDWDDFEDDDFEDEFDFEDDDLD